MKQFEYNIQVRRATEPYLSLEQLNELGNKGWELCGTRLSGDGSDYIFKREIIEVNVPYTYDRPEPLDMD